MSATRHRCPPHLRGEARKQFIALNDVWDQKLRDDEFVDIEAGRDTLRLATSTFSGGADDGTSRRRAHRSLDALGSALATEQATMLSGDADVVTLVRTETAEFWRVLSAAANNLPPNRRHRGYLIDVCDSGVVLGPTAERHRLSKQSARTVWRRFVIGAGLPDPGVPRRRRQPTEQREHQPISVPAHVSAEFRRRYPDYYTESDQLVADLKRSERG